MIRRTEAILLTDTSENWNYFCWLLLFAHIFFPAVSSNIQLLPEHSFTGRTPAPAALPQIDKFSTWEIEMELAESRARAR